MMEVLDVKRKIFSILAQAILAALPIALLQALSAQTPASMTVNPGPNATVIFRAHHIERRDYLRHKWSTDFCGTLHRQWWGMVMGISDYAILD